MIPVTKPFQPPLDELNVHLQDIWKSGIFTNNGPKAQKLELELKKYLGVPDLLFLTNGTIALQLAIKALDLKGEIITTPFTYVATTSSILWEGCTPVFVDIDKETFNIDPTLIEAQITPETSAILATHVFGNPCDIDAIDFIAKKYNLKVIYDGAHAFGVKYKGESIFNYGDITTCSTHATKLFHTVEGGFVVSKNKDLMKRVAFMRNFGHNGPYEYTEVGINGKNSELHAAVGLVNLRYIKEIISERKHITEIYLSNLSSFNFKFQKWNSLSNENYSYFPLLLSETSNIDNFLFFLNSHDIFPRRYFYPALSSVKIFSKSNNLEISNLISSKIICLPLYTGLDPKNVIQKIGEYNKNIN
ncbi:DegT/DnrJ/EryC1/StrS family aminotransferase [Flavobacteriaceae bacterium]|nr:DegT/DnrJ/EryC1/StrS family aminotransferase [Flavobacteriaceae bacterium]